MQIIDELELAKRGPYGGGVGHVSFTGGMDMALALRTMVIPTAAADALYKYSPDRSRREWVVHLQAGAGLVADSVTAPHLLPLTCCRISHAGTLLGCGEQSAISSHAWPSHALGLAVRSRTPITLQTPEVCRFCGGFMFLASSACLLLSCADVLRRCRRRSMRRQSTKQQL